MQYKAIYNIKFPYYNYENILLQNSISESRSHAWYVVWHLNRPQAEQLHQHFTVFCGRCTLHIRHTYQSLYIFISQLIQRNVNT